MAARPHPLMTLIASSLLFGRMLSLRSRSGERARQNVSVGTKAEGRIEPMAGREVRKKEPRDDLRAAAEKYKNWGKWGPDDEIGTLNYTSPEDVVAAAQLVKKGKVISLALNFD